MSTKFKAGDRVRWIPAEFDPDYDKRGFGPNDVGTVTDASDPRSITIRVGRGGGHVFVTSSQIELVTDSESELERLVRVANEGLEAISDILENQNDRVEVRNLAADTKSDSAFRPIAKTDILGFKWERERKFRVKLEPQFEPFYVGSRNCSNAADCTHRLCSGKWKVELQGDMLHIGCRTFMPAVAKNILISLCRDKQAWSPSKILRAYACRDGIYLEGAHTEVLPWEDADKILTALEKADL